MEKTSGNFCALLLLTLYRQCVLQANSPLEEVSSVIFSRATHYKVN